MGNSAKIQSVIKGPCYSDTVYVSEYKNPEYEGDTYKRRKNYFGVPVSYLVEDWFKKIRLDRSGNDQINSKDPVFNISYISPRGDDEENVIKNCPGEVCSLIAQRDSLLPVDINLRPMFTYRVDERDYPYSIKGDNTSSRYNVYGIKNISSDMVSDGSVYIGDYVQDSLFGIPSTNDGSRFNGFVHFKEMKIAIFPKIELITNIKENGTNDYVYTYDVDSLKGNSWKSYDHNGIMAETSIYNSSTSSYGTSGILPYIGIRISYPQFKVKLTNATGASATLFDFYKVLENEQKIDAGLNNIGWREDSLHDRHNHIFDSFYDDSSINNDHGGANYEYNMPFRNMGIFYFKRNDQDTAANGHTWVTPVAYGDASVTIENGSCPDAGLDVFLCRSGLMGNSNMTGTTTVVEGDTFNYGTRDASVMREVCRLLNIYSSSSESWSYRRSAVVECMNVIRNYIQSSMYVIIYKVYIDDNKLKVKRLFRDCGKNELKDLRWLYDRFPEYLENKDAPLSMSTDILDLSQYSIATPRMLWGMAWGLWNNNDEGTLRDKKLTAPVWNGDHSIYWDIFNQSNKFNNYSPIFNMNSSGIGASNSMFGESGCPVIMDNEGDGAVNPENIINPVYSETDAGIEVEGQYGTYYEDNAEYINNYAKLYTYNNISLLGVTGVCDNINNYYDYTVVPFRVKDGDLRGKRDIGRLYMEVMGLDELKGRYVERGSEDYNEEYTQGYEDGVPPYNQCPYALNKDDNYFPYAGLMSCFWVNGIKTDYYHESVSTGTYSAIPVDYSNTPTTITDGSNNIRVGLMYYHRAYGIPHSSFESITRPSTSIGTGALDLKVLGMRGATEQDYANIYDGEISRSVGRHVIGDYTYTYGWPESTAHIGDSSANVYGSNYFMGNNKLTVSTKEQVGNVFIHKNINGDLPIYPTIYDLVSYTGTSWSAAFACPFLIEEGTRTTNAFMVDYSLNEFSVDNAPAFHTVLDQYSHTIKIPIKFMGRGNYINSAYRIFAYAVMQNIDATSYKKILHTYANVGNPAATYDTSSHTFPNDMIFETPPDGLTHNRGSMYEGYIDQFPYKRFEALSYKPQQLDGENSYENLGWYIFGVDNELNNKIEYLGGRNGYMLEQWNYLGTDGKSASTRVYISGQKAKSICATGFGDSSTDNSGTKYIQCDISLSNSINDIVGRESGSVCQVGDKKYICVNIPANKENKCRYFDIVVKYYRTDARIEHPFVRGDSNSSYIPEQWRTPTHEDNLEKDSIYVWRLSDSLSGFVQKGIPSKSQEHKYTTIGNVQDVSIGGNNNIWYNIFNIGGDSVSNSVSGYAKNRLNELVIPDASTSENLRKWYYNDRDSINPFTLIQPQCRFIMDKTDGTVLYPTGTLIGMGGLDARDIDNWGMCIDENKVIIDVPMTWRVLNGFVAWESYSTSYFGYYQPDVLKMETLFGDNTSGEWENSIIYNDNNTNPANDE